MGFSGTSPRLAFTASSTYSVYLPMEHQPEEESTSYCCRYSPSGVSARRAKGSPARAARALFSST